MIILNSILSNFLIMQKCHSFLLLMLLIVLVSACKKHSDDLGSEVSTIAGSGYKGSLNGIGKSTSFNKPTGITSDNQGNFYVADAGNNLIRKITYAGIVTTLSGIADSAGYRDGPVSQALFNNPTGVATDEAGNVYVADNGNHVIRKITKATGMVSTIAGSAGKAGYADGTGTSALFNSPFGIAIDSADNLYVADTDNNFIRKITRNGNVTTLTFIDKSDGNNNLIFKHPRGIALDKSGRICIADTDNSFIYICSSGNTLINILGETAGIGPPFSKPYGVAADNSGNVYIADTYDNNIHEITLAVLISLVAGRSLNPGHTDAKGTSASFYLPAGITYCSVDGNIYVADTGNNLIRKITLSE